MKKPKPDKTIKDELSRSRRDDNSRLRDENESLRLEVVTLQRTKHLLEEELAGTREELFDARAKVHQRARSASWGETVQ